VSASRQKLLIGRVALVGVIALASASPAFAQSAGVGGNIGTFIQNIIDLLNSNVIRGLAVIAIIITGIAWMFGHLDMRRARMNLWLNPRVCAATDASDFDLRDLRERRMSLYLGVSPDNLARVAPLYNLLLQQLVDLNTRERPTAKRHAVQVLMVMDEFARLGHAAVIAHGFSYVAGYGLRLLPVLQSPAQLRAEYGPDLAEEIMANCGLEIAFAPKELKVAQDLSERLGFWTYSSRSHSRPTLLSGGRRSTTESDQRRALMMPQELIQMDPGQLILLRAGMPPVRGRKIQYWREKAFSARVVAPPVVAAHPAIASSASSPPPPSGPALRPDVLSLDLVAPALEAAGFEPLPADGASDAEVETWMERFIDASVIREEVDHGR